MARLNANLSFFMLTSDYDCDRTGYLRNRDTAGQAGETMENQRRGAGNGWKQGGKVRI